MRQEQWITHALIFMDKTSRSIKSVLQTRGRPKYGPTDTMDALAMMIRRLSDAEVTRYITVEASTTSLNFLLRSIEYAKRTINDPAAITAKAMRIELQTKQSVSASLLAGALMAFGLHMDAKAARPPQMPE